MLEVMIVVRFIFTFCIQLTTSQGIHCNYTSYGTLCMLNTKAHVTRVVGNLVLVGSTNVLLVFSLGQPGLHFNESIELSPDPGEFNNCLMTTFKQRECQNDVLTIHPPLPFTRNAILVCSSYSFNPTCTLHDRFRPANYTRIPHNLEGYSPFRRVDPIILIATSSGRFFSATTFVPYDTLEVKVSPGPLKENPSFIAGTSRSNNLFLNIPKMSSAHEYGEHVYFFLYERDVETAEMVATAVRICITDDGVPSAANPKEVVVFRTFQKARMECPIGKAGFHYNFLVSTSLVEREGSTPVLYGAFNPPLNGPPGAAVCKFSFDQNESSSITSVFRSLDIRAPGRNGAWQTYTEPIYSCPGSPGIQRNSSFSETNILKATSIRPILSRPLYLHSQFLNKIVVEELMYDGNTQEIVYLATRTGDILQVIFSGGSNFRYELYSAQGNNPTIHSLILDKVSQVEERNIIAVTDNNVIHIPRGQCYCYIDCFTCFDSKDPYCSWDPNTLLCLNNIVNSDFPDLVQTFTADDSDVFRLCGPRVFPPDVTRPLFPCDADRTTLPPMATSETESSVLPTSESNADNGTVTEYSPANESNADNATVTEYSLNLFVASVKITNSILLVIVATSVSLVICVLATALACVVFFTCLKQRKPKKDSRAIPQEAMLTEKVKKRTEWPVSSEKESVSTETEASESSEEEGSVSSEEEGSVSSEEEWSNKSKSSDYSSESKSLSSRTSKLSIILEENEESSESQQSSSNDTEDQASEWPLFNEEAMLGVRSKTSDNHSESSSSTWERALSTILEESDDLFSESLEDFSYELHQLSGLWSARSNDAEKPDFEDQGAEWPTNDTQKHGLQKLNFEEWPMFSEEVRQEAEAVVEMKLK